jgi:hypothetical protein
MAIRAVDTTPARLVSRDVARATLQLIDSGDLIAALERASVKPATFSTS